jgi:hypothetical protein
MSQDLFYKSSHQVLTGNDASILSILTLYARAGGKSLDQAYQDWMLADLSCQDARQIALAILKQDVANPQAKAFIDWANSLNEHH